MNKGIAIAGNLIADYIKLIDSYPKASMLASILGISRGIGGCAATTLYDIASIDSQIHLQCSGMVGDDENGRYILSLLKGKGIDCSGVHISKDHPTSFTDVMTVKEGGERTFFHARGANAEFSYEHIDFDKIDADIFHIGYILLLDSFDAYDPQYGTVMARTLAKAKEKGLKTSIDVVSENGNRFSLIVSPSLKYCDYVIINELEASNICGIPARDENDRIIGANIRTMCEELFEKGVMDSVVIHAPEASWLMDSRGGFYCVPSLDLPNDYIKGTVGAGDAFCAGMLYSIYKGYDAEYSLRVASLAAAACLSCENSSDGMKPLKDILCLEKLYTRKQSI